MFMSVYSMLVQAYQRMRGVQTDWYFCRGYFLQQSNSFQPYTSAELGTFACAAVPTFVCMHFAEHGECDVHCGAADDQFLRLADQGAIAMSAAINDGSQPEEVPEMEEPEPPRQSYQRPPAPKRKTSAGRACEECGITNTPQWREGPNGGSQLLPPTVQPLPALVPRMFVP